MASGDSGPLRHRYGAARDLVLGVAVALPDGSDFKRSTIYSVGPVTVQPRYQDRQVGRQLMSAVLDRADQLGVRGVRLVQAGYHNRSLSLYTTLGFAAREPLVTLSGGPLDETIDGCVTRPAAEPDIDACDALCAKVHGHGVIPWERVVRVSSTVVVRDEDGR